MRALPVPVLLLLTLTTSTLCAPISMPLEECSQYASCRPYLRSKISLWRNRQPTEAAPSPYDPHFPAHQRTPSSEIDPVEVKLLEHILATPDDTARPDLSLRNPKLNAVLNAAYKDRISRDKKLEDTKDKLITTKTSSDSPPLMVSELEKLRNAIRNAFPGSLLSEVKSVSARPIQKCGTTVPVGSVDNIIWSGDYTITYTYGYSYIERDRTDVLVVTIVVLFIVAVVVIEQLEKVVDISRPILGLGQRAIRLEDCDGKSDDVLPPYSPRAFHLQPVPPPRKPNSISELAEAEYVDEKVPLAEAASA